MNILLSTWSLQIGGAEIFVLNFAKELSTRRHTVYIFVESDFMNRDLLEQHRDHRIKILSFCRFRLLSFIAWKVNALFNVVGFKANFYKRISDFYFFLCLLYYRIDLISSHTAYSDVSKVKWVVRSKRKMVFTDHGECAAWAAKDSFFFKDFLVAVTAVVSVSKKGIEFLLSNFFIDNTKLHLIYNGVLPQPSQSSIDLRDDLKIEKDAFVFGMLGRDSMQKGWDIAIHAFQSLLKTTTREDIHLVLIGVSKENLRNTGLFHFDNRIHFIEATSRPGSYINITNVGLIPSCYYEGLPTAAIEFLYANKPVIASNLGGIPEIIRVDNNCSAGILIELTSDLKPKIDLLTDAMKAYLNDDNLLETHIACSKKALGRFSMSVCVDNYESLFNKVLNG